MVVGIAAIGAYQVATQPLAEIARKDGLMSLPIDQADHTKGSATPKATLVEYSDFQCPACGTNYPWVEEVFAEYKDRMTFTYRHFPLAQHKNALVAAYASEASGNQGKFWEMTDLLFKNQSEWSESVTAQIILEGYAQKLGLDITQFKSDMKSDAVKAKIERDQNSGKMSAIDHTPTFFINGKLSDNPRSKEELKALIEYAITHP